MSLGGNIQSIVFSHPHGQIHSWWAMCFSNGSSGVSICFVSIIGKAFCYFQLDLCFTFQLRHHHYQAASMALYTGQKSVYKTYFALQCPGHIQPPLPHFLIDWQMWVKRKPVFLQTNILPPSGCCSKISSSSSSHTQQKYSLGISEPPLTPFGVWSLWSCPGGIMKEHQA